MYKNFLTIAASILLLAGCWAPPYTAEEVSRLETQEPKLSLVGDKADGSPVTDTLRVVSNRSWSASVDKGDDWMSIDTEENLNLGMYSTTVTIIVSAENNTDEPRSGSIKITTDGVERVIPVVQAARVPRISVPEAADYGDISSDAGEYPVTVLTNMPWSAEVAAGATAKVSIDTTSGEGNGRFTVHVAENEDNENTKEAIVLVKAEKCEPVQVKFVQRKGAPYLRFADNIDEVQAEAGVFDYEIRFRANVPWTAKIESFEGLASCTLAAESGTKADTSVIVKFPPATCFGSKATVKIKFGAEGVEDQIFTITQDPVLRVQMIDPATSKVVTADRWPFSYPTMAETTTKKIGKYPDDPFFQHEQELVLVSGYKIKIYSSAGLWYTATTGLNCGGSPAGSYLGAPAIEGRHLVKVWFKCAAATPKNLVFSVVESDKTTVVSGGEQVSLSASLKENTWTLSGTKDNTEYFLISAKTGNFYMGDLIFYYE